MRSKKHKNNIIIGGLLAIVLVMGIGYAAFSSKLSINGTGSVSSNFDVKITGITSKNIVGTAGNKTEPTYTDTTATFYTTLQSPSDSITYDITVTNNGTIDTVLNDITTINGNNSAITFETSGLSKGDSLLKGETKTLTVKVTYNSSVTSQPSNTTSTLKVSLNFIQKNLDSNGIALPAPKVGGQDVNVVTIGDGLYEDSVTEGRYFYRGTTPNNYITFNNETWRIMSIEKDGTLKIIRNEQLSEAQAWDAKGTRNGSTSTYCVEADCCNAWAATSNLIGTPSIFKHFAQKLGSSNFTTISGSVIKDASLNTYLNETYYNSLPVDAKANIVKGIFNISGTGNYEGDESLETITELEKEYQWKGYVALSTATEFIRASTNSSCTGLGSSLKVNCGINNWLLPSFTASPAEWLLSPGAFVFDAFAIHNNGNLSSGINTQAALAIRPVLHLSSSIKLSGSGSSSDPYQIVS